MTSLQFEFDRFDGWKGRLTISAREAAHVLGISPSTLRRLEKDGTLRPTRANRRVLYSVKCIEAWLAAGGGFSGAAGVTA